jgi:hypothetical protein
VIVFIADGRTSSTCIPKYRERWQAFAAYVTRFSFLVGNQRACSGVYEEAAAAMALLRALDETNEPW